MLETHTKIILSCNNKKVESYPQNEYSTTTGISEYHNNTYG